MKARKIYITQSDKKRLEALLTEAGMAGTRDQKDLDALAQELAKAEVVPPQNIPPDVVTMNSKVVIRDVDTSETMTYTLVFPDKADIDAGAISVLAPVGMAMLGYASGDVVKWPVPSGIRRIRIEDVLYQPEAAGDFHL
jgi:regulator of nucleoside diphosphate kinase